VNGRWACLGAKTRLWRALEWHSRTARQFHHLADGMSSWLMPAITMKGAYSRSHRIAMAAYSSSLRIVLLQHILLLLSQLSHCSQVRDSCRLIPNVYYVQRLVTGSSTHPCDWRRRVWRLMELFKPRLSVVLINHWQLYQISLLYACSPLNDLSFLKRQTHPVSRSP